MFVLQVLPVQQPGKEVPSAAAARLRLKAVVCRRGGCRPSRNRVRLLRVQGGGAGPLWPRARSPAFAGRGLRDEGQSPALRSRPPLRAPRSSDPRRAPRRLTEPREQGREGEARSSLGRDPPPRSLLASECRGRPCAMRHKWPVRAAVAREVCVATETTSDLEGPLGARELSSQHRRCYRDHVAGPGAGATLRADQPAPPSLRTFGVQEPHIHAAAVTGPKGRGSVWSQPTGGRLHAPGLLSAPGPGGGGRGLGWGRLCPHHAQEEGGRAGEGTVPLPAPGRPGWLLKSGGFRPGALMTVM